MLKKLNGTPVQSSGSSSIELIKNNYFWSDKKMQSDTYNSSFEENVFVFDDDVPKTAHTVFVPQCTVDKDGRYKFRVIWESGGLDDNRVVIMVNSTATTLAYLDEYIGNGAGWINLSKGDTVKIRAYLSAGHHAMKGKLYLIHEDTEKYGLGGAKLLKADLLGEINKNSFPESKIMYFSTTYGDDGNTGTTPMFPKKDPFPYIEKGGYCVYLMAGDVFKRSNTEVGNNTKITTYGGEKKAILDGTVVSQNVLQATAEPNIYQMDLSEASNMGFVRLEGSDEWFRKRMTRLGLAEWGWALDEHGKWSHIDGVFRIYSDFDISGEKICYTYGNGLKLKPNRHDIIIDGIEIRNFGHHGINGESFTRNITIRNCKFENIGGDMQSEHRLGNAIQFWNGNCQNILIEKNRIDLCYDTGITAQGSDPETTEKSDYVIRKNHITNCAWCLEFGDNTEQGIDVEISNNLCEWSRDITDGWRDKSSTRTGLLCLWNDTPNDVFNVHDNVLLHVVKNRWNSTSAADVILGENGNGVFVSERNYFVSTTHKVNNHNGLTEEQIPIKPESLIAITSDYPTTTDDMAKLGFYRSLGLSLLK